MLLLLAMVAGVAVVLRLRNIDCCGMFFFVLSDVDGGRGKCIV